MMAYYPLLVLCLSTFGFSRSYFKDALVLASLRAAWITVANCVWFTVHEDPLLSGKCHAVAAPIKLGEVWEAALRACQCV